jgi:hypothetical protein
MEGITDPDNKDYLKTDERMTGGPGAVPEECGFIHGGLSQLQHNVLQRTERSLNEGDREENEGRGRRRFLKKQKTNLSYNFVTDFCSVLVCL